MHYTGPAALGIAVAVILVGVTVFGPGAGTFSATASPLAREGASHATSLEASDAPLGGSAPTSPPVSVCGNSSLLSGPSAPPAGAVPVPAGNDSNYSASYDLEPNTTYWLAPGIHTLGTSPYSQFQPDAGDTFLGAPGAVIDGQGLNQFAFTSNPNSGSPDVTIEYLTVQNFISGEGEGVVNQNGDPGWIVAHNTIGPNEFNGSDPGGAGVMLGSGNVVEYNCLTDNGEYGFSSFGSSSNITLAFNEISFNDALGGYDHGGTSISCGCSGGGKLWISSNVTVSDNYVHDNGNVGIWVDTDNTGVLIAHNYISNNYAEGVIYEISYNGLIENNTFVRNAIGAGPGVAGFPDSAVYISESGFDARVANPLHAQSFQVAYNVFSDNWGGVVIWENPNRFCSDGSDQVCTLVDPDVYTLTTCAQNLSERSPLNYYDNCRWRAENVSVDHNVFFYAPTQIGTDCITANFCGFNGLFSAYGEPPYSGPAVPINITFKQDNHFTDNAYDGPWQFEAWSQGNPDNPVNWTVWRANVTDECSTPGENSSGTCDSGFGQDQGSSLDTAGGPIILSFAVTPSTIPLTATAVLATSTVGGQGSISYRYLGLPPGCATANATFVNCTPTQAGNFSITVSVNDTSGHTAAAAVTLTVTSAAGAVPPPSHSSSSSSGTTATWIYAGIAGAVAGLLVVGSLALSRRRRRGPVQATASPVPVESQPSLSTSRQK